MAATPLTFLEATTAKTAMRTFFWPSSVSSMMESLLIFSQSSPNLVLTVCRNLQLMS
jgi:hypothetical protein